MIIIFNHKNNLTYDKIIKYEKKLRKYKIIILPSNCYLSLFQKGKYILGAQDISKYDNENITGDISGKQLKSLNVKYVLIGHSDRLKYYKEDKIAIKDKIKECINNNIIPMCCINTLNKDEIKEYIDLYLKELKDNRFYIIYEPIKNIGNKNPNINEAYDNISYIKEYINNNYNRNIKVIYGGGVNKNNIETIKAFRIIDGIIVSSDSIDINNIDELFFKTYS